MRLVGKDLKQLVVGPKVLKHREVWGCLQHTLDSTTGAEEVWEAVTLDSTYFFLIAVNG